MDHVPMNRKRYYISNYVNKFLPTLLKNSMAGKTKAFSEIGVRGTTATVNTYQIIIKLPIHQSENICKNV
jgi:hypothetical protein